VRPLHGLRGAVLQHRLSTQQPDPGLQRPCIPRPLAGGAEQPRDLDVPGRALRGIRFAMEFLSQQNRRVAGDRLDFCGEILAAGKR